MGWGGGGNLTNVQSKAIQNCHNNPPPFNEYILIKMKKMVAATSPNVLSTASQPNSITHSGLAILAAMLQSPAASETNL
jgi:hypothetical protein